MSVYAKEIKEIPILSFEEENKLLKAARAGSVEAKKKLVKHNMHAVLTIAQGFKNKINLPLDDIIGLGCFGLYKAIDRYEEKHGIRLYMFVYVCVKGELKTYMSHLNRQKRNNRYDLSLQTKIAQFEDDRCLEDFLPDEDGFVEEKIIEKNFNRGLLKMLNELTEEERKLLILRYGFLDGNARSCDEVGRMLGIRGERVRVKCIKTIKKLRHPRMTQKIKDFL